MSRKVKNFITVLFICKGCMAVLAQDTTYYEKGKIYLIEKWVNGKRDGLQKVYYRSGQLWEIGKWKNGMQTGVWKTYHENGRIEEIGRYRIDKSYGMWEECGKWKTYYENGKLMRVVNYKKNGDRKGRWREYYENGRLRTSSKYINGYLWGKCKYYDEKGKLLSAEICY